MCDCDENSIMGCYVCNEVLNDDAYVPTLADLEAGEDDYQDSYEDFEPDYDDFLLDC